MIPFEIKPGCAIPFARPWVRRRVKIPPTFDPKRSTSAASGVKRLKIIAFKIHKNYKQYKKNRIANNINICNFPCRYTGAKEKCWTFYWSKYKNLRYFWCGTERKRCGPCVELRGTRHVTNYKFWPFNCIYQPEFPLRFDLQQNHKTRPQVPNPALR